MVKECNIEKEKKCRSRYFQRIIYNAKLSELKAFREDLNKEIELGETAKSEGFNN
jgi:hypothetical protein